MTMRSPTCSHGGEAIPPVAPTAACGLQDPDQAVTDFVGTQRALGATLGEAVGMAVAVHGEAAVAPRLEAELAGLTTSPAKLQFLDGVAQVAPTYANATLNDLLVAGRFMAWKRESGIWGLHLQDRPWILSLPDAMPPMRGGLCFQNCVSLHSLPERLRVNGYLDLEGCTSLHGLPDGLEVGATLCLKGCTSLGCLPSGLQVGMTLDIRECTSLTHFMDGLRVAGGLLGNGCASLTHLPVGLHVGEAMDLSDCTALRTLPPDLEVGDNLRLTGCTSLAWLPEAIEVGRSWILKNCTALESLPSGLHVKGDLDLQGCASLTHLPPSLKVDGMLNLRGCTSWDGKIPDDAKIGGKVFTGRYPGVGITLDRWRVLNPKGERG